MLSTLLEAMGLAVITAGVSLGVLVLASAGWAIVAFGLVGGTSLVFVGVALSAPEPPEARARPVGAPLTNGHVERV